VEVYSRIARGASNPHGRANVIAYLDRELPPLWEADYRAMTRDTGELVTITFRDRHPDSEFFVNTMFDLHSTSSSGTESRVVAVWGLSRSEPASTRDKARMAGFLRGVWSDAYQGRDRGHFFAHTMGGGVDINLFPQLARVNQGGKWKMMEQYAAKHPGSFCFIRPFYARENWIPTRLEYGIFQTAPGEVFKFRGDTFEN
jgi:DNA/RNA non-specific endonuclease